MRWVLTGGRGMLATDLRSALLDAGEDVVAFSRSELDVTSAADCADKLGGFDVVVNTAAWTGVDDAETHEADAFQVNAVGAANVARAARAAGARLVHISTDYVFAGDGSSPYLEDAALTPRSAYGRTKAAGEWAVRSEYPESDVVRTAWLYGEHGANFVKTMAALAERHDTVKVVDDQTGQPTWTHDVARIVIELVGSGASAGTFHATSSGQATWFELTQALFAELGLDPSRVEPTTTAAFPRPAPRPAYSVLGHDAWTRAGLAPIRDWREAIAEAAKVVAA